VLAGCVADLVGCPVPGNVTHASRVGSGALGTQHSSRWLNPDRDVALLFAGASFRGSPPMHLRCSRFRQGAACKLRPRVPMPTRRASRGWTSLPDRAPTSDVPSSPTSTAPRLQSAKSAHHPCRCRTFGFHPQVRIASRTPGEERVLRTIQNAFRRERPSHAFAYEASPSGLPVKVTLRETTHTVSPSLVPPRALNATATSLGLDDRALTRPSRCVRPTSAIHSLPEPVPALSAFGLLGHPPVRASGATEGSVVSRRAGPASTGRAATRPGCHRRVPFAGVFWPLGRATWSRSVHDFVSDTPSPSGSRFRHCRTACVGARRIETAFTVPREGSGFPRSEMPSSASSPDSPAEPPPPCLATTTRL